MEAKINRIEFSRRQRQVLLLIALGLTTGQIALKLSLSKRTVLSYSSSLRSLAGASNNANLVHICWQLGVLNNDIQI